jgi:glycosyltransferase involved in cell wall biosynthesis
MSLVGLRRELEARGWDCPVMNLNENRRIPSPDYIDVQNGWDYFRKVWRHVRRGYAVHVRVNGDTKKGYLLALMALVMARLAGGSALLTYCGGHKQNFFPAPKGSFRHVAFALLFRVPSRIYCNSEPVKQALLTTGIDADRVLPIPHFSAQYVQFSPAELPEPAKKFSARLEGTFFLYICYRREYMLEFLAEAMRRFRDKFPGIGFLLVGTSERELDPLGNFFKQQNLQEAVCITGSVSHDLFLTLLTRSLAYIRIPQTDGVCSSVLEALTLKVPVLGSDNGTRPAGVELWQPDSVDSLLARMIDAAENHHAMVSRIPAIAAEDNTRRLADDVEAVCLSASKSDSKDAALAIQSPASERKSEV